MWPLMQFVQTFCPIETFPVFPFCPFLNDEKKTFFFTYITFLTKETTNQNGDLLLN